MRITATHDAANYVRVDKIGIRVGCDAAYQLHVVAIGWHDNNGPETVATVLDQPIPFNATIRFAFNHDAAINIVELIHARGDANGDGKANLADITALQDSLDPCHSLTNAWFSISALANTRSK